MTAYQTLLSARLTERQRELLAAYAKHETTQLAADALGISPQTFKNRLSAAYRALDVQGAAGAWKRLGWLIPPEPRR
jgi:DNA-binding CsgD family transcriptional regulator